MFIKICGEHALTIWRNQKYFSTWQSRAWETGKPGMSYINENSFSRLIIEKSDGLTTLGLQKLSETVGDYAYLILTSQTSMRGPIIGHEAQNLDAQQVFLNTFESIINRRVDIPEEIQRFQKTLQYTRSKVDYVIGEFIYMLPSDMNLRIGKVKNYNNKILISSPGFTTGTKLKISLNGEKDKPDTKSNKEHKQDVKVIRTKPNIKKEHEQDIKMMKIGPSIKFKKEEMMKTEPDTHEEEKAALILGITSIFTVWWLFK